MGTTSPDVGVCNVFSGESAIRDLLNPESNLPSPLVELPGPLNPYQRDNIRIFMKLAYLSPLLNIKWYASLNLLLDAQASGKLKDVHTIVESSSGNKVFVDAILARLLGIPDVVAIVPPNIAPGKLKALGLFGVSVEYSKEPGGQPTGISMARQMGMRPGFFNPGQYENDANPRAYEKWLAPELWKQTDGKMTVFCAGLGTTGTIVGASRYLRKQPRGITIVGVICAPGESIPGARTESRLQEIKFSWRDAADHVIEIGTRASFTKSLELCRSGLLAGPSSGLALAGLLRFLEARLASSTLDDLRNSDGEIVATVICPDSALLYLDEYSEQVSPATPENRPQASVTRP